MRSAYVVCVGGGLVVAFCCYSIYRPKRYFKNLGITQGKPNWIFGHTFGVLFWLKSWADLVLEVYQQGPGERYTGMYQINYPVLVIKDLDLIKQMFIKDFEHFTDHISFVPAEDDPLWTKNVFARRGKNWRDMRTLLSKFFTTGRLRSMFDPVKESTESFVQYFLDKDEEVITVEMKDIFCRFTNGIIAKATCDIKVDPLTDRDSEFYRMSYEAMDFGNIWKNVKFVLYGALPFIRKILHIHMFTKEVSRYFQKVIDENIMERETRKLIKSDLIGVLLQARNGPTTQEETPSTSTTDPPSPTEERLVITNEDIAAQVLVFFIGGFESASSLMCFVTYELAINSDVQEVLRQEILSTWRANNGNITHDILLAMKYMDMVLSECVRKWPIQVSVDRMCTKPYTIQPAFPWESSIHLPANIGVSVPIFALHRDPIYFPHPEKFDPERFNKKNKGKIKQYSYLPFGIGPRGCIGSRFALMETKLMLFNILMKFELVIVEKTDIPFRISKKSFALNAEEGFWIGLKKLKIEKN